MTGQVCLFITAVEKHSPIYKPSVHHDTFVEEQHDRVCVNGAL